MSASWGGLLMAHQTVHSFVLYFSRALPETNVSYSIFFFSSTWMKICFLSGATKAICLWSLSYFFIVSSFVGKLGISQGSFPWGHIRHRDSTMYSCNSVLRMHGSVQPRDVVSLRSPNTRHCQKVALENMQHQRQRKFYAVAKSHETLCPASRPELAFQQHGWIYPDNPRRLFSYSHHGYGCWVCKKRDFSHIFSLIWHTGKHQDL